MTQPETGMDNAKRPKVNHKRDTMAEASFELSLTAEVGREFLPFLRKKLRQARPLVRGPLAEFSVAIVGNRRMAELHEQFMNVAGPTDVLTFELEHDGRGRVTSGEVVICLPVARKKAKELGHAPRLEVLLYAIHGMLHLCGFDDRNQADYRKMHAMEDRILTSLGIGPVFAAKGKWDDRQECLSYRKETDRNVCPTGRRQTGMPVLPGGRKCC